MKSLFLVSILFFVSCTPQAIDQQSQIKVVNGQDVGASEAFVKSTVMLKQSDFGFCTGTLIGPRHILTAGHCAYRSSGPGSHSFELLRPEMVKIGVGIRGERNLSVRVKHFVPHPKFRMVAMPTGNLDFANDIGIIILDSDVNSELSPVDLAPADLKVGQSLTLVGYGQTAHKAANSFGVLRRGDTTIKRYESNMKAFQDNGGWGSPTLYMGDSGGPTYYTAGDGSLKVVSASSATLGQCESSPGLYTDATKFQSWLKCTAASKGAPLSKLLDDTSAADCGTTGAPQPPQMDPAPPLNPPRSPGPGADSRYQLCMQSCEQAGFSANQCQGPCQDFSGGSIDQPQSPPQSAPPVSPSPPSNPFPPSHPDAGDDDKYGRCMKACTQAGFGENACKPSCTDFAG